VVERQLPKLNVVGSIPIARSSSLHCRCDTLSGDGTADWLTVYLRDRSTFAARVHREVVMTKKKTTGHRFVAAFALLTLLLTVPAVHAGYVAPAQQQTICDDDSDFLVLNPERE
jgi:hypothetical protein